MYKTISGNYNLIEDQQWYPFQSQDVYLTCDTSVAPVNITVPPISSMSGFLNVRIYISDASNNASTNNITIISTFPDTINGGANTVISENGGSFVTVIVSTNKWIAISSSVVASSGVEDLKFQRIPSKSDYLRYIPVENLWGVWFDAPPRPLPIGNVVLILLDNGDIGQLGNCMTVMSDGIYIYSSRSLDKGDFYWVAMRQSAIDPQVLEKVAELPYTHQFNDYYYEYTVRQEDLNVIKFVAYQGAVDLVSPLWSAITTLDFNSTTNTLTAVDSYINFGYSILELFESLSGQSPTSPVITSNSIPYYTANDEFYNMMSGRDMGWVYYTISDDFNALIGYNILSGSTVLIDVDNALGNVTNFPHTIPTGQELYKNMISHPLGVLFFMNDGYTTTNGTSEQGVTAVWSPRWVNNTLCVRIGSRAPDNGNYSSLNGFLGGTTVDEQPFLSPKYLSIIYASLSYNSSFNTLYIRFALDVSSPSPYEIFSLPVGNGSASLFRLSAYPTNTGFAYSQTISNQDIFGGFIYSEENYAFWNDSEVYPLILQGNVNYPSNFIGDKIYGTYSSRRGGKFRPNYQSRLVTFDTYKGQNVGF